MCMFSSQLCRMYNVVFTCSWAGHQTGVLLVWGRPETGVCCMTRHFALKTKPEQQDPPQQNNGKMSSTEKNPSGTKCPFPTRIKRQGKVGLCRAAMVMHHIFMQVDISGIFLFMRDDNWRIETNDALQQCFLNTKQAHCQDLRNDGWPASPPQQILEMCRNCSSWVNNLSTDNTFFYDKK